MVRADPETIERRLNALRTSKTFVEAAGQMGEALSTLKTWCRRNDGLIKSRIPGYEYDDYLQLKGGELLVRCRSAQKAAEKARQAPRRPKEARTGRVHTLKPEPAPVGTMSLADAAALIIREVDQLAALRDEMNLLRAENEELKEDKRYANLMARIEILEEDNARLRTQLAEYRAKARAAGAMT